jgi:hypothetical protein
MYVSVGRLLQDVLLSGDTVPNGRARENRAEIVTDAVLSQAPHRELERELMPWKPDDDASENLSLNFSHTWRLLSFIILCFSILMREIYIYSSSVLGHLLDIFSLQVNCLLSVSAKKFAPAVLCCYLVQNLEEFPFMLC